MGLLSEILGIQSYTENYTEMHNFILKRLNMIKGVLVEQDEVGNIYATKGVADSYSAYVCHTDTVHQPVEGYQIYRRRPSHIWLAIKGFKDGKAIPTGIGGDDKCGIYICLQLLASLTNVKCVFFVEEEMYKFNSCRGSAKANLNFFDNCKFIVQCDRKGNNDIIVNGKNVELCSKEFKDKIIPIGKRFGYAPTSGAGTDVVKLKERGLQISTINISVGYYLPHTDKEFIVERDLIKALDFCREIDKHIKETYFHEYTIKKTSKTSVVGGVIDGPKLLGMGSNPPIVHKLCRDWKYPVYCTKCFLQISSYTEKMELICEKCKQRSSDIVF